MGMTQFRSLSLSTIWGGALLAGLVLGAMLARCSRPPERADAPSSAASAIQTFRYGDRAGSVSAVERVTDAEGRETLRGRTEILRDGRATEVVEEAWIDPAGNLLRVAISVSSRCGESVETRVVLDRPSGTVHVEGGDGSGSFEVPGDAPWVYAPVADATGFAPSTPVAAWVAFRAARHAPVVRVIDAGRRTSYHTTPDQVAIPTELGTTVVLGYDGIDVDDGFVRELRLTDHGIRLTPLDGSRRAHLFACALREPASGSHME
jgi:hypothetical protein